MKGDSVGGSNRRRQQRSGGARGAGQPAPAPKSAWRENFEAWGGYPIFGSLAGILVVVGLLIYMNRAGATAGDAPYVPVARAQVDGRLSGSPDAPVKIIEFADFQCPFCKQWADAVEPGILEEFVNQGIASLQYVSFAFIGDDSRRAAAAAECAADQNRFWDYHDILFLRQGAENTGVFSNSNLKQFGGELQQQFPDFDTARFDQCVDSGEKLPGVDAQTKQGQDAGVRSTPSFLINGASVSGVQPLDTFRELIRTAQAAAAG